MDIVETGSNPYGEFSRDWEEADGEHGFVWDKETHYFELMEGGDLAGYFFVVINGGVGELKDLIVKKNFRSRGFGKAAVDYFMEFCRGRKCHKLIILTSERHIEGRALYEKCGFAVENTMKNDRYHATWYFYSKVL